MLRERIMDAGSIILVVCAVALTAMAAMRMMARDQSADRVPGGFVSDWRGYTLGGHRIGPDAAAVVVVVFSDYQCPACVDLAATLDTLRQNHNLSFVTVHRHFPAGATHPLAWDAAVASECAAHEGKFAVYSELLYQQQTKLSPDGWNRVAAAAGIADTLRRVSR